MATQEPQARIGTASDPHTRRPAAWRGVADADWNDWHWQARNSLRRLEQLEQAFSLGDDEKAAISALGRNSLPIAITPYYASLIDAEDPACPIRRTLIPSTEELHTAPGELRDPCGEDNDTVVPGLVHRYPDRVLLLATGTCAVYCRYCTRSRMVGGGEGYSFQREQWRQAADYIAAHPSIRDVLISGGDPLLLEDHHLDELLGMLRAIPHLEIIRIGTKIPAVMPQRITPKLTAVLRKYHPFYLSVHFIHPSELTPEAVAACERLADAGIPLGSQTVLLKGVNDTPQIMRELMHGLLKARVRPYYLYQCDPIAGSGHLRTAVADGVKIIEALRGHTTGYAVPTYVIDAPGGGGKVPVSPHYVVGQMGEQIVLRNYANQMYEYPDTAGRTEAPQAPSDDAPDDAPDDSSALRMIRP
ncbi:MAG: KamA family radical SAM protein [Nitrospirota bacterium]|nr:KamA family radical SAM protein [Nitrospirota bacterium]